MPRHGAIRGIQKMLRRFSAPNSRLRVQLTIHLRRDFGFPAAPECAQHDATAVSGFSGLASVLGRCEPGRDGGRGIAVPHQAWVPVSAALCRHRVEAAGRRKR